MDHDPHSDAPRNDAARIARDVEGQDIKWLMSQRQGRRFMHRLLAGTGLYHTSFTGNSTTFFNEGKRSVGLQLLADLAKNAPDDYLVMLKEGTTK